MPLLVLSITSYIQQVFISKLKDFFLDKKNNIEPKKQIEINALIFHDIKEHLDQLKATTTEPTNDEIKNYKESLSIFSLSMITNNTEVGLDARAYKETLNDCTNRIPIASRKRRLQPNGQPA